ncbi:PP2C family protein-serine/threonine phosphatase [Streptomyces sp. NBC_00344]|uniref:PP2C family protein-serine/threonine phosphatase n=1 Tax=Streptomyces sp. NBC_00344 TaxID=2975720 RepID=UPI003FA6D548
MLDVPDDEPALHLVSCGHPPPLLLRGGQGRLLEVRHPAPPLGLTQFVETDLTAQTFAFDPGDIVRLYTDGVIEARDAHGMFHPLTERVLRTSGEGPEAILAHLREGLRRHTGGRLDDDAAIVAIERLPQQA